MHDTDIQASLSTLSPAERTRAIQHNLLSARAANSSSSADLTPAAAMLPRPHTARDRLQTTRNSPGLVLNLNPSNVPVRQIRPASAFTGTSESGPRVTTTPRSLPDRTSTPRNAISSSEGAARPLSARPPVSRRLVMSGPPRTITTPRTPRPPTTPRGGRPGPKPGLSVQVLQVRLPFRPSDQNFGPS